MLFRKNSVQENPRLKFTEPTWDEQTVKRIAERDRFDVRITQSSRHFTIGYHDENRPVLEPEGCEVHGVLTYPKYILVNISFGKDPDFWLYSRFDHQDHRGKKVNLPMLEICIADPEGRAAKIVHDAHRDAILCGRNYSGVRVWKRKGEGLMTDADKQHDWSYESRYSVFGMTTWSELVSKTLPRWAYDPADKTVENIPERYDLEPELG
jgi:hypothetical protein